jgi:hypothetical protein
MTSKIKADNLNKVSDDSTIIKKCGSTTTVGSGSGQTIVVDGATITLGRCGGTVSLASGATQSGFGRTGTVDWCTTAKTGPLTAVSGKGYFINTTGGVITVTLPSSPTAGDIIALKDYANTWDDNNVTVARNGSKIGGQCNDATLETESQSVTLIYVDGTKGWQDIHDSTSDVIGGSYITASGGNQPTAGGCTVDTNFKIHKFTSTGTFTVASGGGPKGKVDFLVVAGGGGGGGSTGPASHLGGGGAGGYRESKCSTVSGCWSASPLAAAQSLTLSPGPYTITVGGGGAGGTGTSSPGITGTTGSVSTFSTMTSAGGGGGGGDSGSPKNGLPGGSGGGGSGPAPSPGGTGNTPPVSPPQGNDGGTTQTPFGAPLYSAGGGGGAGAVGANGTPSGGGAGGAGVTSAIDNTPTARGGGGAGQQYNNSTVSGGSGGGGNAGPGAATNPGTVNTGGGGGGGGGSPSVSAGGNGGSGIVFIRYRFQ